MFVIANTIKPTKKGSYKLFIYHFKTLLASERSERDTHRSIQSRIVYNYYWRASEASETLSGLFN